MTTRGVEHVRGPVVPGATHAVECSACGARLDVGDGFPAERHKHFGIQFVFRDIAPPLPPPPPPQPVTEVEISAITKRLDALEKAAKPVIIALALLLIPAVAHAWTDVYTWATGTNTTSYKVETSIDSGATWQTAGTPSTPGFTLTMTSPGLTLVRLSNCNANGCTVRAGSGFFHNEAWAPPLAPVNLMITP